MSYNGSGTFQINTSGQPVVAGTVISSTAFNALTADLATGLSTAITKDGQTATTVRIPFAAGINSSLTTDSSSTTTGSIITAGGVGIVKNLYVGANANIAGTLGVTGVATFSAAPIYSSLTASSAVATDASKGLVSVTNTGTGNNVLATSPTLVTPVLGAASATSVTVAAGAVGTPSITTTGDTNTGIFFPAADTIAFTEGGAEAMRIDSSGNVGIGTASPIQLLTLESTGNIRSTIRNSTENVSYSSSLDFATGVGSLSNSNVVGRIIGLITQADPSTLQSALAFHTNGGDSILERMRIDSSGNLLVGTTSTFGTTKFSVKGGGATSASNSIVTQNSGGTTTFVVRDDGLVSVGSGSYNNTTGSAANTFIDSNGYIFRSTSSLKYKKDVNDATHGLTDLLKLRSVTYKSKTDGNIIFGGFIAEEVDAAGLNEFVQYAADGSPDALAYGNMVSLCVKAIQEQQALITALTARITALESK